VLLVGPGNEKISLLKHLKDGPHAHKANIEPEVTMPIPEPSDASAAAVELAAAEAEIAQANQRAAGFLFGAQKLMLEELVFAGNEFMERTQTEMHLFSEFASKIAGAHSVKDVRTMYEECGKHQIDFVRRDCDRLFQHGRRMIEAASSLFKSHPLN
jgi:hypothetical protein